MYIFNGNTEIVNSNFNEVEYGTEKLSNTTISVAPEISDIYATNYSDNMDEVYTENSLNEDLDRFYEESPFFEKYGRDKRKIEKSDIGEIYYYFKYKLLDISRYNIIQIFCAIAEYFELNYKTLYNDIISLTDKSEILEALYESHNIEGEFNSIEQLF